MRVGNKPPPRQTKIGEVHYAFARVHLYPPQRVPKRLKFQPELINRRFFLVDAIRPYPEWPLICKLDGRLAFESEATMHEWLGRMSPSYSIAKVWTCGFCSKVHVMCWPHEVTGTTSGKSLRKDDFKKRYNLELAEEATNDDE